MKFFDGWKRLNSTLNDSDLTATAQLAAYKIFALFNDEKFPESLSVGDRELMRLCNIKSGSTIVEIRRKLKNVGLIDFTTSKGKPTIYRLGHLLTGEKIEHLPEKSSTNRALTEHLPSTRENSNITRARDKTKEVRHIEDDDDGARAKILKIWTTEIGNELHGQAADKFVTLAKEFGIEKITQACVTGEEHKNGKYTQLVYVEQVLKGANTYATSDNGGDADSLRHAVTRGAQIGSGHGLQSTGTSRNGAKSATTPTRSNPTVQRGTTKPHETDSGNGQGRFDNNKPNYSRLYADRDKTDRDAKRTFGQIGTSTGTSGSGTLPELRRQALSAG